MTKDEIEAAKKKHCEDRANDISYEDIFISSTWTYLENVESSRKLLERLIKHHGDRYADIRHRDDGTGGQPEHPIREAAGDH